MFARLLLLFIIVPLLELYIFLTVGSRIGIAATVAIVIITGFLGAYLTKSQGLKTLARYRESIQAGKLPHQEILDGLMILAAGAVLLTPGFLTDAIGFALLVPSIRNLVRQWLGKSLKTRVTVVKSEMADQAETGKSRVNPQVISVDAEVIEEGPTTRTKQE